MRYINLHDTSITKQSCSLFGASSYVLHAAWSAVGM